MKLTVYLIATTNINLAIPIRDSKSSLKKKLNEGEFLKFVYASSYLQKKTFTWKQDRSISLKLQTPRN